MDVSKLSPAQWHHSESDMAHCVTSKPDGRGQVIAQFHHGIIECERLDPVALAAFAALARNAFDVQIRRGWFAVPCYMTRPGTFWRIKTHLPDMQEIEWREFPDPYTALVEADKWYKANISEGVIG